jgi:DNA-binding CsgD family transcriptional regulator
MRLKGTPRLPRVVKEYSPTKTEIEVLQLRWAGKTHQEIGEERFVSVKTLDAHLQNLREKVGAKNIVELYKWGLRTGHLTI